MDIARRQVVETHPARPGPLHVASQLEDALRPGVRYEHLTAEQGALIIYIYKYIYIYMYSCIS